MHLEEAPSSAPAFAVFHVSAGCTVDSTDVLPRAYDKYRCIFDVPFQASLNSLDSVGLLLEVEKSLVLADPSYNLS